MPGLQRLAQQILDDALAVQGRRLGVSQGALVAMRPDGAVLAMVGGRDYRTSQFNRAVDANRQPGSAFKLFVYLAALRNGYSPQDTIDAGPVDINGWKPENFDNERYGRITLAEAFARSVNTAAVRLAMNVGLDQVISAARDLGIDAQISQVPSLALGTVGVSLLDLTSAFASVRSDRMHVQPWGVAAVGPADGSQRWTARRPLMSARTLDPYQKPLVDLLQGVVEYGTGRAAALDGFAAGKTGTSQDYRDAWFIGFNEALVVGVWVGNDDDAPMKRVVGGTLPASIWKRFMTEATPLIDEQGMLVAKQPTNPAQLPDALTSQSDDQAVLGASQRPDSGFCDYQACSSFYHSFRASDCTYQPFSGGPRQLCEKGKLPSNEAAPTFGTPPTGPAPVRCNIDVCARFYMSFNPSDCTYQPYYGGPRQLCEK
jgi:membrane peptidoglycan carboxypeptidase